MQNVLPDQVTLGYILRSCNPRPWDGSDQYLVRTVSFEIPFLDFCSNFVQMFSRVLATRINNKTYGLDTPKPQRRSGPLFRMQSVRTVSRRNLIIKWWRFSYFLNPHFIPNKLIGGFFNLPSYWKVNLIQWYFFWSGQDGESCIEWRVGAVQCGYWTVGGLWDCVPCGPGSRSSCCSGRHCTNTAPQSEL